MGWSMELKVSGDEGSQMINNALVLLSGGIDSSCCLAKAIEEHGRENVETLFVYYGSKHGLIEDSASRRIADYYGVRRKILNVKGLFTELCAESSLLLGGENLPEGHYEDPKMKSTVVPGRNLILAAFAASYAESNNCRELWLGCHRGDEAIYPDCRPEFIYSLGLTIGCSSDFKVKVRTPFIKMNKTQIVSYGVSKGLPFEKTRTCYQSNEISCGNCGSCQERLEAFKQLGIIDPLEYESK